MIITKQKPFEELLEKIGTSTVFLIGCSECATLCHTGGEEDILNMKTQLEKQNISVTGWIILDPACHFLNDKRMLKKEKQNIEKAEKILVFSCGNGVQTVAELITDKEIITGTDSLFLGEIKRTTQFEKRCSMCGDCQLDLFEGFCPITRCPKSMLNGPCGGSTQGKCEINKEMDCVWDLIFKKLQQKNRVDQLKTIQPPKNWSTTESRRIL